MGDDCAVSKIIVGSVLLNVLIMPLDDKTTNGHNYKTSNSCG